MTRSRSPPRACGGRSSFAGPGHFPQLPTDRKKYPDTLDQDPEVLRDIGRRFGGRLALNADVARGGTISIGDAVRLVRVGGGSEAQLTGGVGDTHGA